MLIIHLHPFILHDPTVLIGTYATDRNDKDLFVVFSTNFQDNVSREYRNDSDIVSSFRREQDELSLNDNAVLVPATDEVLFLPDNGSSGMKLEIMIYASFKS